MNEFEKDLGDILLEYTLTQVLSLAHPQGAFTRLSPYLDEVTKVRAKYNESGYDFGKPTQLSEAEIAFSYSEVYGRLKGVREQITLSMKLATPTLAMLMERDVVTAALGVVSGHTVFCLEQWAALLALETPGLSNEEAISQIADLASKSFGGEGAMSDQASALAQETIASSGKWYIEPVLALAESMGAEVEPPDVDDPTIFSWLEGAK